MSNPVTYNDVLAALYFRRVRVKPDSNGRMVLLVQSGQKLPQAISEGVRNFRLTLIEYYGSSEMLQNELDDLEIRAQEAEKDGNMEVAADLWRRYYIVLEDRGRNMLRPWAKTPEDQFRCPVCPHLGEGMLPDGIICESRCIEETEKK